jgi:hypothetical protein
MNTRAKLNASILATGGMLWLNILSYPLGMPGEFQLVINVATMVPITLNFIFLRRLRAEQARDVAAGRMSANKVAAGLRHARKRLIILWILLVPFVLSFPLWLPKLTGVSVGGKGDFLVALATLAMISLILGLMIRRLRKS